MRWQTDGVDRKEVWWKPYYYKVLWMYQDVVSLPRKVWLFVKKVVKYAPLLWSDRDFDYSYIFEVLRFKLKLTREHIIDHNILVNADEVGKEIKYAEDILDRLTTQGYYDEEAHQKHEEKWGESVWNMKTIEGSTAKLLDSYRVKARELGLEDQERKEERRLHEADDAAREKDLDDLFVHLRKHIEGWWC